MSNKLMSVIIDNPRHKCWQYRTRDTVMVLATLAIWLVVLSRLHTFYTVEEALIDQLYSSTMLKVLVMGFITTFLTFHLWAMYNRYLYVNVIKRAERATPPPALEERPAMAIDPLLHATAHIPVHQGEAVR